MTAWSLAVVSSSLHESLSLNGPSGHAVVLRIVVSPVLVMKYSVWWHWHLIIIHSEILLLFNHSVILILHIEAHIIHILFGDWKLVWFLLVLRTVLLVDIQTIIHIIHLLIVGQWASIEVSLVHLHRMDLPEVHLVVLVHHVHVHHWASAAFRWCAGVWETTAEAAARSSSMVHTNATHWHSHLLMEVDDMKWVHHLLVLTSLIYHVVNRHLALSPRLLWRHRHVIRLIHGVLVLLLVLSCVWPWLLVWILYYFVHLNFVTNGWWRLRVLQVVHVWASTTSTDAAAASVVLLLMDIVLTATRRCASWVWIDASNSVVWSVSRWPKWINSSSTPSLLVIIGYAIFLGDVDATTVVASLAESTSFRTNSSLNTLWCICAVLQRSLSMHWCQKWISHGLNALRTSNSTLC